MATAPSYAAAAAGDPSALEPGLPSDREEWDSDMLQRVLALSAPKLHSGMVNFLLEESTCQRLLDHVFQPREANTATLHSHRQRVLSINNNDLGNGNDSDTVEIENKTEQRMSSSIRNNNISSENNRQ